MYLLRFSTSVIALILKVAAASLDLPFVTLPWGTWQASSLDTSTDVSYKAPIQSLTMSGRLLTRYLRFSLFRMFGLHSHRQGPCVSSVLNILLPWPLQNNPE